MSANKLDDPNYTRIIVTIPKDLKEEMQRIAITSRRSMTATCLIAIEEHVNKYNASLER